MLTKISSLKTILLSTFIAVSTPTLFGMYGTIQMEIENEPKRACLTSILSFLGRSYKPVEICDIDYKFAQALQPFLVDLQNFNTLNAQEKQQLAENFLNIVIEGLHHNEKKLDRTDTIMQLSKEQYKILLDSVNSNPSDVATIQFYYAAFIKNFILPESVIKALMITFILGCNDENTCYKEQDLEDFCIRDLAEIVNERCDIKTDDSTKQLMALTGAEWPGQIYESIFLGVLVSIMSYPAGMMAVLLTSVLFLNDLINLTLLEFGLPAIMPPLTLLCFAMANSIAYHESVKYKPVGYTLF